MSIPRLTEIAEEQAEPFTGGLKVITTDHAKIHAGEGFSASAIFAAVLSAAVVNYCFKTPTVASGKLVHFKYREVQATANKIRVDFLEAPSAAPINGTTLAPINRNRAGVVSASQMQAFKTAMDINTAGAVTLHSSQFVGGQPRDTDIEFVLKPDTWYIVQITNGTGATADISFFDFWYEE